MSGVGATGATGGAGRAPQAGETRAQVRKLAQEFEGVFLNQLFQVMRQSVPQGGAIDAAPGQEIFTQFFDQRMADEAARRMKHGIGEALYRQLAARLPAEGTTEAK